VDRGHNKAISQPPRLSESSASVRYWRRHEMRASTGDSAIEARCQHAGQSVRSASRFVALPLRFFGGAPNYVRFRPSSPSDRAALPHHVIQCDGDLRRPRRAEWMRLARSLIRGLCPKKPRRLMPVVRKPRHAWRRTPWNRIKGIKEGSRREGNFQKMVRDAADENGGLLVVDRLVVLTIRIGENRFVEAK